MEKRIVNPMINRLRDVASKLRSDFSRFYGDSNRERVRFTYGDSPFAYYFKVRFTPSHRTLKFIVPKENPFNRVEIQQLEKTDNIIRDIDTIYLIKNQTYVDMDCSDQTLDAELSLLWRWGVGATRKGDVFKARAEFILPGFGHEDMYRTDTLYVGLIDKVTPLQRGVEIIDGCEHRFQYVSLRMYNNAEVIVQMAEDIVQTIYPGLIYMENWVERYNIMRFTSAKHHIVFTEEQMELICDYLNQEEVVA